MSQPDDYSLEQPSELKYTEGPTTPSIAPAPDPLTLADNLAEAVEGTIIGIEEHFMCPANLPALRGALAAYQKARKGE
jgi:hypothetical protein